MTDPVKLLVWGIPAEIVREIGLRLRGVVISEFDNAPQMGQAAAVGDARLILLSDALPTADSIYIVRRAKDTSDDVRVAFSISMQEAETTLHALKEIDVDRFFLAPVDVEESLREWVECRFCPPRHPMESTSRPPYPRRGIAPVLRLSRRSTSSTTRRSRCSTPACPPISNPRPNGTRRISPKWRLNSDSKKERRSLATCPSDSRVSRSLRSTAWRSRSCSSRCERVLWVCHLPLRRRRSARRDREPACPLRPAPEWCRRNPRSKVARFSR